VWYIYLHEWSIFVVNVAKYTIHWVYGKNTHTHIFCGDKKTYPAWTRRCLLVNMSLNPPDKIPFYTKYLFRKRPGSDFFTPKEWPDHKNMSFILLLRLNYPVFWEKLKVSTFWIFGSHLSLSPQNSSHVRAVLSEQRSKPENGIPLTPDWFMTVSLLHALWKTPGIELGSI